MPHPFFSYAAHTQKKKKKIKYNPYLNNPIRHTIFVSHKYKIHLN